jgi:hypothetical protein
MPDGSGELRRVHARSREWVVSVHVKPNVHDRRIGWTALGSDERGDDVGRLRKGR